jgi:tetratricopeptide (TPR) repeat protein
MHQRDSAGHQVTGATADGLAHFETAAHQFRCYIGDPVASVDAALAAAPQMAMAHVLKAYLHLLGTEPLALPVARDCLAAAADLAGTERERGHVAAVRLLTEGRWSAAGRVLEDVSVDYPLDALALQAGHSIDFFRGDSRMLRDRIARALPAWSTSIPGYHALRGMHAFGLEETGDYTQAERQGRKAVELERRDTWAWHAVAHTYEMRNEPREGLAWMSVDTDAWSQDSFLAVHNWWHRAVYHLELGEPDAALQLFDGPVFGKRSSVVLELIDASALLWRLMLRGVDVGDRYGAVADNWAPIAAAGTYAFNDMHAMIAFVGADRVKEQQAVLEAQRAVLDGELTVAADNLAFTREVGHPATRAIQAFGQGRYAECVELLRPIRHISHRFGGSHAQRDLLDQTLIEASRRAGFDALTIALVRERVALRPRSPLAALLDQRAQPLAKAA